VEIVYSYQRERGRRGERGREREDTEKERKNRDNWRNGRKGKSIFILKGERGQHFLRPRIQSTRMPDTYYMLTLTTMPGRKTNFVLSFLGPKQ